MRMLAFIVGTAAALAPVAAMAGTGNRVDNSGIFIWVFLGFCALIVISQVLPALLLIFGLTKAMSGEAHGKKTVKNPGN